MGYKETYSQWRELARDEELAEQLLRMEGDEQEIKNRFSSELKFGTAGLRGVMGAGTDRMNIFTVSLATQGLAEYVNKHGGKNSKVAVAYDTRKNSARFAQAAALCLCANGIKTYLFSEPTSVPELSFTVKHYEAFAGVVITASHNPKEYNGYKVYAPWGGQLLNEPSNEITSEIEALEGINSVMTMEKDEAIKKGLLVMLGEETDREYYSRLAGMAKKPELIEKYAKDVSFVYTPLYGTGLRTFKGVMERTGYKYTLVEEQCEPDGDFPGVPGPNPEDERAMAKALELAKQTGAEIAMGTDPDADRMGVCVRSDSGEYIMLSGNQVGCILAEYLLRQRKEAGELKPSDFIVKSFVSTAMADSIAEGLGAECITVPTGFKYIADAINTRRDRQFVFGFEESCGFLAGDFVSDKDGVMAVLLMLEVLCECKERGETLYERLNSLYEKYGWHREKVISAAMEGADGMEKITSIMRDLREKQPEQLGGQRVLIFTDYLDGTEKKNGEVTKFDFPSENALKFTLESGWLCIRPSGTEPKIKVYAAVAGKTEDMAKEMLAALESDAKALVG